MRSLAGRSSPSSAFWPSSTASSIWCCTSLARVWCWLAVWLIAAVLIHHGVLSPLVIAVGCAAATPGSRPRAPLPAGRVDHGRAGDGDRHPDDLPAGQPAAEQGATAAELHREPRPAARHHRRTVLGRLRDPGGPGPVTYASGYAFNPTPIERFSAQGRVWIRVPAEIRVRFSAQGPIWIPRGGRFACVFPHRAPSVCGDRRGTRAVKKWNTDTFSWAASSRGILDAFPPSHVDKKPKTNSWISNTYSIRMGA